MVSQIVPDEGLADPNGLCVGGDGRSEPCGDTWKKPLILTTTHALLVSALEQVQPSHSARKASLT